MVAFFLAISPQIAFCDCYAIVFFFFVDLQNPHFQVPSHTLVLHRLCKMFMHIMFFHIGPTIQGIALNKSLSMACGDLKT